MRGSTSWVFLSMALLMGPAGTATAGMIVVSGDTNITNALVGNGTAIDPGNQRFFTNLLQGGTRVLVQGNDIGGIDTPVASTNSFYNTRSGVTSTILSGAVTTASLAGVNLFVSAIPATAFTTAEIAALSAFSTAGGSIFLMADAGTFSPTGNANLNALLVGLGSTLRIVPDILDPGFTQAGPSQIAANPLTTGVTSLTYTFVSQVSGGTTLFRTTNGSTFIAASGLPNAVPEPSSLALTGLASLVLLGFARRGRPVAA